MYNSVVSLILHTHVLITHVRSMCEYVTAGKRDINTFDIFREVDTNVSVTATVQDYIMSKHVLGHACRGDGCVYMN